MSSWISSFLNNDNVTRVIPIDTISIEEFLTRIAEILHIEGDIKQEINSWKIHFGKYCNTKEDLRGLVRNKQIWSRISPLLDPLVEKTILEEIEKVSALPSSKSKFPSPFTAHPHTTSVTTDRMRFITWDLQYDEIIEVKNNNIKKLDNWFYQARTGDEIGLVINNHGFRFTKNGHFVGTNYICLAPNKPPTLNSLGVKNKFLEKNPLELFHEIDVNYSGGISAFDLVAFSLQKGKDSNPEQVRQVQEVIDSVLRIPDEDFAVSTSVLEMKYYDFLRLWPELIDTTQDSDPIITNFTCDPITRETFTSPSRHQIFRVTKEFARVCFKIEKFGMWGLKLSVVETSPDVFVVEVELSMGAEIRPAIGITHGNQKHLHVKSLFNTQIQSKSTLRTSQGIPVNPKDVSFTKKVHQFQKNMEIPSRLFNGDRIIPSVIFDAIKELNQGMIGREEVCSLTILALMAGEHLFLYGPPGTGKSMMAQRMTKLCAGNTQYFERLLSTFSTPEDLFGPISLQTLKVSDSYRRKITGYLPTAHFAFIDEIFKANKGILNALLTILNEREFDDGPVRLKVPLRTTISASNEVPTTSDMKALFDRFLLRAMVDRVGADKFDSLLNNNVVSTKIEPTRLRLVDISMVKTLAKMTLNTNVIPIPPKISAFLVKLNNHMIIMEVNNQSSTNKGQSQTKAVEGGTLVSDRRWVKFSQLLKVVAFTNGRSQIRLVDCFMLLYGCWEVRHQLEGVKSWMISSLRQEFSKDPEESKFIQTHIYLTDSIKKELMCSVTKEEIEKLENLAKQAKDEENIKIRTQKLAEDSEHLRRQRLLDDLVLKETRQKNETDSHTFIQEANMKEEDAKRERMIRESIEKSNLLAKNMIKDKEDRLKMQADKWNTDEDLRKKNIQLAEQEKKICANDNTKVEATQKMLQCLHSSTPIDQKIKKVEDFLRSGADPNYRDPNHNDTAFTICAWHNFREILDLMYTYGKNGSCPKVNINAVDQTGKSALISTFWHVAGKTSKTSDETEAMIKTLLKFEPNVNLQEKEEGNTALHYAVRSLHVACKVVPLLLQKNADPNLKNKEGKSARDAFIEFFPERKVWFDTLVQSKGEQ